MYSLARSWCWVHIVLAGGVLEIKSNIFQGIRTLLRGDRGCKRLARVLSSGGVAGGDGGVGLLIMWDSSKQGRFPPRQSIITSGEIRSC